MERGAGPECGGEDARRLHRELGSLKKERTGIAIGSVIWLVAQGLRLEPHRDFLKRLETLTLWDGTSLPAELKGEIEREYARLSMIARPGADADGADRARR